VAGLRVSEVLGLHSADIDRQGETLRVDRRWYRGDIDEPKSESSKRTRQIGSLAAELLAWAGNKDPQDFIFQREDGNPPDDRDLQQHVWRPAAEAVGIYHSGFGMHTFRRLNVTWRQHAGATPIEAQKAAGHASLDMTFLYTQNDEAREREHVTQIMDRIKSGPNLATMNAEGKVC
jgi:integrase